MKLRGFNRKKAALTLVEVLVAVVTTALLGLIILTALAKTQMRSNKIGCVNNLKQIGLACRIWSGDNYDKYPAEVLVASGGVMETAAVGDAVSVFQVMSNELSTPKILFCPNDAEHSMATNFGSGLTAKNVSYFVGIDAKYSDPQAWLSGDDNFQVGGIPVQSGVLKISSDTSVGWTASRHKFAGNIGLTDCSVQSLNNSMLSKLVQNTNLATNHLAIP